MLPVQRAAVLTSSIPPRPTSLRPRNRSHPPPSHSPPNPRPQSHDPANNEFCQESRSSNEYKLMTNTDYFILGIALVLSLGGLIALPWLCQSLIRLLHQSWRNSEGGGCPYNPLQEMIQPNIRH